ncbi:MAG: alpha/beta hydrolase, partial [Pseudonocardiaceae bacterium]
PMFGPGPLPDVPVLLLEGEDDLRTPVESARRVAGLFPRSRLVVAPATGHSAVGSDPFGCTRRAIARFFRHQPVSRRCPRRRRPFPVLAPPPERLRDVRPAAGVGGIRGRALAALALTLRDVSQDSMTQLILDWDDPDLARGGGLRGGRYRLDGDGTLHLTDVAFVPGVRVSGRLRRFEERGQRGRVRLRGPGGPGGALFVRGRRVVGRLGGRRVSTSLAVPAGAASARALAARLPGPR